jgi:hypothetical protein
MITKVAPAQSSPHLVVELSRVLAEAAAAPVLVPTCVVHNRHYMINTSTNREDITGNHFGKKFDSSWNLPKKRNKRLS